MTADSGDDKSWGAKFVRFIKKNPRKIADELSVQGTIASANMAADQAPTASDLATLRAWMPGYVQAAREAKDVPAGRPSLLSRFTLRTARLQDEADAALLDRGPPNSR